MPPDDSLATLLTQKYSLVSLSVFNSTQISSRTAAVTSHLGNTPAADGKTSIVALTAKSKAANKLISIVEIAKRDLLGTGVGIWQYNALTSEMVEIPRGKGEPTGDGDGGVGDDGDGRESEDDAFETMGTLGRGAMKKRLVPVMTTYLSNAAVKELRNAYGEQRGP